MKVFQKLFATKIQNPGSSSLTKVITRDCLSLLDSVHSVYCSQTPPARENRPGYTGSALVSLASSEVLRAGLHSRKLVTLKFQVPQALTSFGTAGIFCAYHRHMPILNDSACIIGIDVQSVQSS